MDTVGRFKRCSRCAAVVPEDASFCGQCGGIMGSSCPNCQKPVDPQTQFCCYCGLALAPKSPAAPLPDLTGTAKAAPAAIGVGAATPAAPEPVPARKADWTRGEKDSAPPPVVILEREHRGLPRTALGIVALVGAAAFALLAWQWSTGVIAEKIRLSNPPAYVPPRSGPSTDTTGTAAAYAERALRERQIAREREERQRLERERQLAVDRIQQAIRANQSSPSPAPGGYQMPPRGYPAAPPYQPSTEPGLAPRVIMQPGMTASQSPSVSTSRQDNSGQWHPVQPPLSRPSGATGAPTERSVRETRSRPR